MNESLHNAISVAKLVQNDIDNINLPPEEGTIPNSNLVLSFSIVRDTRGYIEKVVHQINGCYEKGWYDGCSVMIRRLIETLIIEVFEKYKISNKIKDANGDYKYLNDLINSIITESTWNLGRETKSALRKLKKIGDRSAHSRRFTAHRTDIDNHKDDIRITTQELLYLAELK